MLLPLEQGTLTINNLSTWYVEDSKNLNATIKYLDNVKLKTELKLAVPSKA